MMSSKRPKALGAPAPAPVDISSSDREALIAAFRAGLITAWKHDAERGYRVSIAGRPDDYVDVPRLTKYLERLGGAGRSS